MTDTQNLDTPEVQEFSPILYTFANRSPAPELESLLAMFYQSVLDNTLGIMQAYNAETEQEEVLLVGVHVDENGKTDCYPITVLLSAETTLNYRAPDGKGGYFNPTNEAELQLVKDSMKPVDESLVVIEA